MKVNCSKCGKEVNKLPCHIKKSKTGNVYCSKTCANSNNNHLFRSGSNHPNYSNGLGSYREKAIREKGAKCEACGIEEEIVLEVHHKDKNRSNNSLENLQVVCANCHRRIHRG